MGRIFNRGQLNRSGSESVEGLSIAGECSERRFNCYGDSELPHFPPFVLQALADEGYLDLGALDPVPIVMMETVTKTFEGPDR